MKRIFYFLMAAFMMISVAANAQTIKNDGVFSHMYIGINGGANQSTVADYSNWNNGFTDGIKSLTYNAGIEVGKDVTPITGFSLQGSVSPIYNHVTNGSGQWNVNRLDVFGNTKFNLMNLFGGYKGYPRRVEIRTVTGIGWNHNINLPNPNDMALQAGFEFDFNLGKNRNWYITFTPMVQTNNIFIQPQQIENVANNADLKANFGVFYRLGRHHHFEIVEEKTIDENYIEWFIIPSEGIDTTKLYAKYNELLNRAPEVDTVVVEKIVEVEKVVEKVIVKPIDAIINFEIGSSKISDAGMNIVKSFANEVKETNFKVNVIGSADSSTGSKERNEQLAIERANNVANELINCGVEKVSIKTVIDIDEDAKSSRCAVIVAE